MDETMIERMAIQDAASGDLNTELTGEARRIYLDARDDAVRARRRGVYPQFFETASIEGMLMQTGRRKPVMKLLRQSSLNAMRG